MLRNYISSLAFFKETPQRLYLIRSCQAYSSRSRERHNDDKDELQAARDWFEKFDKNTIPESISKTAYSYGSGPGGQKTNKTNSKATTVWPMADLANLMPKILVPELRTCRYYVASSDSIAIQCDSHRNRTENKDETHRRLNQEVQKIYSKRIPGVTSPEMLARVEQLQKAGNTARLRLKKSHSAKKQARRGGSFGGD